MPVSFIHKNGAVIWVNFDEEAIVRISMQLESNYSVAHLADVELNSIETPNVELRNSLVDQSQITVPKAKDGSLFPPQSCNNKQTYFPQILGGDTVSVWEGGEVWDGSCLKYFNRHHENFFIKFSDCILLLG